ncbi:cytochrome P450 [Nemania sp. FL0031]|nr:cytochrome P450 [Nemania sp. FL0031]
MAPAFSAKATRAKDPILQKYIDIFVEKMKEIGNEPCGVSLPTWIQWLAMDIAADMAYHHEVNCMRNESDSAYLSITLSFNKFVTMTQVLRRFPAIGFLRFVVFPVSLMGKLMELRKTSLAELHRRITLQGATEHLDYFGQLVPADGHMLDTDNPKEILHLSKIATQLMFAGYLPPSDWYYGAFFHLLHNRESLDILTQEIRETFTSYDEITPNAVAPLPYLNACMNEALRLFSTSAIINGMPVYSPGAIVDGHYIPKGTTCQFNTFSVSRSPRYFHDPHQYRPQRWLPTDHVLFEAKFANDNLASFSPFGQGPRICVGREVAWWQARLVMAKILWTFDVHIAPGQKVSLESDLKAWGYWVKPELRVRFLAAR